MRFSLIYMNEFVNLNSFKILSLMIAYTLEHLFYLPRKTISNNYQLQKLENFSKRGFLSKSNYSLFVISIYCTSQNTISQVYLSKMKILDMIPHIFERN